MRTEYEPDGWIRSEDFNALGDKFLGGELGLREFIEKAYGNYEKVRGKKPDIEDMIRNHENVPPKRALVRISFLISVAQGFIRTPGPESPGPKTIKGIRQELVEAWVRGEGEAMFVLFLELIDLLDEKIAALEEANNHDPFRLIGKQG